MRPKLHFLKYTKFVKPEGAHDETFMKLLKLYYGKTEKLNVEIKKGHGGDQPSIVREATERIGDFNERIVIMDCDRPDVEMRLADVRARTANIQVIRNVPCIEALFIRILEPSKNTHGWSSAQFKSYFETTYIPRSKRTIVEAYKAVFSENLLDAARNRINTLDALIKIFEDCHSD